MCYKAGDLAFSQSTVPRPFLWPPPGSWSQADIFHSQHAPLMLIPFEWEDKYGRDNIDLRQNLALEFFCIDLCIRSRQNTLGKGMEEKKKEGGRVRGEGSRNGEMVTKRNIQKIIPAVSFCWSYVLGWWLSIGVSPLFKATSFSIVLAQYRYQMNKEFALSLSHSPSLPVCL